MKKAAQLFYLGLAVHLLYNLVIVCTSSRLKDFFQPDTGQLTEIITAYAPDSRSYIESADNFITFGTFGKGDVADYHRTIGYPFILSVFKLALGDYWYFGLALFQTILGALIYPLSFLIGSFFFRVGDKTLSAGVVALLILGGYFTKSLHVLTDLTFAVFFLLGFLLSILAVTKKENHFLMIPALLALAISGLIRPTLLLYPVAHVLVLIYVSYSHQTLYLSSTRWTIIGSTLVLIVAGNLSSFRLYSAYQTFSATDVLGINMFDYSTRNILIKEGRKSEYDQLKDSIASQSDWQLKDKIRKRTFFEAVKKYPISAISYWKQAAKSHTLSPHYMEIGTSFGFYKEDIAEGGISLRKSSIMIAVFYVFYAVNWFIILAFGGYLIEEVFVKKNFLGVLSLLAIIVSILGPSFIALTGARMRIPVEPFLVIPVICFIWSKSHLLSRLLQRNVKDR